MITMSRPQLGSERLFDIGEKGLTVHRAVEDHGSSDAVGTQPGGEGGGFPMAMGHGGAAWLAPGRTTIEARHLGGRAVSSIKTIRVGSRSSCPSNHASRAAFTALRRCSAACAVFFCA